MIHIDESSQRGQMLDHFGVLLHQAETVRALTEGLLDAMEA